MEVLGTLFSFLYPIAEFALVIYLIFFLPKKIKKKKQEEASKEEELRLQRWIEEQEEQQKQAAIAAQKRKQEIEEQLKQAAIAEQIRQQEVAIQLKQDERLRLEGIIARQRQFCESSKPIVETQIISFFNNICSHNLHSAFNLVSSDTRKLAERKNAAEDQIVATNDTLMEEYHLLLSNLRNHLEKMNDAEEQMIRANETLMKEYHTPDQLASYSKYTYGQTARILDTLENHAEKLSEDFPKSRFFSSYGTINPAYRETVLKMHTTEVYQFVDKCEKILDGNSVNDFYTVDYDRLFMCMWCVALQTPFVSTDFQRIRILLYRIFRTTHTDVLVADLYTKYNIGGEKAIYADVKWLIEKNAQNSAALAAIASGLMWMKAYESEQRVLQHMLATGMEMSMSLQQRLHSLANGGGKSDNVIEISSADNFYFDVSPIAWKDNDFTNLFDNLAFQGKTLTYALAIRDEDKELSIPIGIPVPSAEQMQDKLASVLDSEYEGAATSKVVDSVAISGSGEESLKGVLVTAADCAQMGILIHSAKIGRKLTIKLYTLFVPANNEVGLQKKQVLSLCNKLSLSTTQWESSLKTTILTAIQQLLNDTTQTGTNGAANNIPVF